MKAIHYAVAMALVCLSLGACAPTPSGLSIEVDQAHLKDVTSLKLNVIDPKRKDDVTMSCLALLKGDLKLEFSQFTSETEKVLLLDQESQTLNVDGLKPGKKLFLAAGYGAETDPNKPKLLGCAEGTIEKGKKISVALALVVYNAPN